MSRPTSATQQPRRADPGSPVSLPPRVLAVLAARCSELGPAGVASLREAGRCTGESLYEEAGNGQEAGDLELTRYWREVREAARSRGLGTVEYWRLRPALGLVELRDSPEAAAPRHPGGGCHFAVGWLGGLLTRTAGRPVSVLEVACAVRSGDACRFLVGDDGRLRRLAARLRAGAGLGEALGDGRSPGGAEEGKFR